jgi:hypothetical protein
MKKLDFFFLGLDRLIKTLNLFIFDLDHFLRCLRFALRLRLTTSSLLSLLSTFLNNLILLFYRYLRLSRFLPTLLRPTSFLPFWNLYFFLINISLFFRFLSNFTLRLFLNTFPSWFTPWDSLLKLNLFSIPHIQILIILLLY